MLITRGRKFTATNRAVLVSNNKVKKSVERATKSTTSDALEISRLISMVRKKMRHRGIVQIKQGDRNWGTVKEIAANALAFTTDFELDPKEGFRKYITLGITKMNKFNIQKFPSLHEAICIHYEAELEIREDPHPKSTRRAHDTYRYTIETKTGLGEDLTNQPWKYVWFVRASKKAKEMGVEVDVFIKAQFHGLEWTRGIPEPAQLLGKSSVQRVAKFLYEMGQKAFATRKPTINWDKVKANGH